MENFIKKSITNYQLRPYIEFYIQLENGNLVQNFCQFDEKGNVCLKPEYQSFNWIFEEDFNYLETKLLSKTEFNKKSILIFQKNKEVKDIENVDRLFNPNTNHVD